MNELESLKSDLLSHYDVHEILNYILMNILNEDQIEEVWCIFCGDDTKYDKGGYGE